MPKNNRTADRVQAVWNILGGEEGVDRLLRREITVSETERVWREQNGVIYFSVTSDSTTGEKWIKRLVSKDFRVSGYAKSVLHSLDFKPTDGVTTEIAVLKGMLFSDNDRITKKIRAEADKRKLTKPNAEVACLIREKFTDEEIKAMGLWGIVAMHEPIRDSDYVPRLLFAGRYDDVGRWFDVFCDLSDFSRDRGYGFAFAALQV